MWVWVVITIFIKLFTFLGTFILVVLLKYFLFNVVMEIIKIYFHQIYQNIPEILGEIYASKYNED